MTIDTLMESHANTLQNYLTKAQNDFDNAITNFQTLVIENNKHNYYKDMAEILLGGNWLWPYHCSHSVSSPFYKRSITNGSTNHAAIDIAVGFGTPIYPIASGTVEKAGWNASGSGYGYSVEISHNYKNQTYISRYSHLKQNAVNKGDKVTTNTIIGYEGNSGGEYASHLDFTIMENTIRINPIEMLIGPERQNPQKGIYVPENYKELTRSYIEKYGYPNFSPFPGEERTYWDTM